MPVKKGKGCVSDVMREWKAGTLHSGETGSVVKDKDQAVAIALSMCGGAQKQPRNYAEEASKVLKQVKERCGAVNMAERPLGDRPELPFLPGRMPQHSPKFSDGCGCGSSCDCKSCKSKYGEATGRQPALGYPTPQFDEEEGSGQDDETLEMVLSRLRVIVGRTNEIAQSVQRARSESGTCSLERWMIDKLTLAADYVSAVAGEVYYGGALEEDEQGPEVEEYDGVYGGGGYPGYEEKSGLEKACWPGYEAVGMKKKRGRPVPNCVPKGKK